VESAYTNSTVRRVPEGKMRARDPVRKGKALVTFGSGETAGCVPSLAKT